MTLIAGVCVNQKCIREESLQARTISQKSSKQEANIHNQQSWSKLINPQPCAMSGDNMQLFSGDNV